MQHIILLMKSELSREWPDCLQMGQIPVLCPIRLSTFWLYESKRTESLGMSDLGPVWVKMTLNRTILGEFLKSDFWNLISKRSVFAQFGANLTHSGIWSSGKLPFDCQKIAQNLIFFKKNCPKFSFKKKMPLAIKKKEKFWQLKKKKSNFGQFFDIQMAIFQRVSSEYTW